MVDGKVVEIDHVKEQLIEAINDSFGCDAAYYGVNPLDLATRLIANGVMVQQWIRPEERLPDVHKPVLVCREKEPGVLIVEQGCKDLGDWWRVYGTRVKRIRYWMPLPEAPKEV